MRRLKGLALVIVALVAAGVAAGALVREFWPLPRLVDRTETRVFADTGDTPLGRAIEPLARRHPGLTGIHPLADAVEAFAARISLARAATRSIDVQYYIWHGDLTGNILFNELLAAADRGVRVRLLLDDNNTVGLDPIIATLEAHPNIEVRLFNPFAIRRFRVLGYLTDFARLNRRMHNKSFTVDNQATIIGGRNIGDEYFGAGEGALFVDLDILAVGPVVPEVSRDFDRYWASASAHMAGRVIAPLATAEQERIRAGLAAAAESRAAREYLETTRALPLVDRLRGGDLFPLWAPVRMLSDDPAKGLGRAGNDDLLFSQLAVSMGRPGRQLALVSGYFVPARAGTEALIRMAERGVEVTVLTNTFEATDVRIVHAGYAKWRKPLLRAGIRIFEMRAGDAAGRPDPDAPGTGRGGSRLRGAGSALHAKTMAVDGERVFVGSFNFDPRSANLNTELGFVIESPAMAERMDDVFARFAPARAYEVRLSAEGELYWLERGEEGDLRYAVEPGTTRWQRAAVRALSLLPIEWLL